MSTSYNTTVKLYSQVPLVKGGTEVLYLSAGSAEGVLAPFLKSTYSAYYFERENRRYIQIDDIFGNIDDVNYISFANNSHGGKIYFAFVDQVIYINDHNTQIEFTIDPFPTFLGDTSRRDEFFVIRNTPRNDVRGQNLEPDYVPDGVKSEYNIISSASYLASQAYVFFTCKTQGYQIANLLSNGVSTGIQVGMVSGNLLQDILDHGGQLIGLYCLPACFDTSNLEVLVNIGTLSGNPLSAVSSFTHEKIRTGVYVQPAIVTANGIKTFELEQFANVSNIEFAIAGSLLPAPTIYVYPKNYKGIAENVAEGIAIPAPSMPFSASAGYSDKMLASDIFSGLASVVGGAVSGAGVGGVYGAVAGGLAGALGGAVNIGQHAYLSRFNAPQSFQGGHAILASDKSIHIDLVSINPSRLDLNRIDAYFDYYGYNVNHVVTRTQSQFGQLSLEDGSFLQTGSEFVTGSEADVEINARIMQGIKIRKTLS